MRRYPSGRGRADEAGKESAMSENEQRAGENIPCGAWAQLMGNMLGR